MSVVLPVYNGVADVADTLARLDEQTYRDFEVVIVDDGSSDGTTDLLRAHAAGRPEIVVHVLPVNRGVAVARNTALTTARGRYLWFVDHDDAWDERFLEVMVPAAAASGADVVVCGASLVERPGAVGRPLERGPAERIAEPGRYLRALLTGEVKGYLWNKLFRRDLFGPDTFPPLSSQSDFAGHFLVAERVTTAVRIEPTLYRHVLRPGSITRSTPKMHNLYACLQIVQAITDSGSTGADPRLLRYFDLWFGHLGVLNTALRLEAQDERSAELVADARRAITWRSVLAAAHHSPRVAVRAALVRCAWPLYRLAFRIRGRRRRRGSPGGEGRGASA